MDDDRHHYHYAWFGIPYARIFWILLIGIILIILGVSLCLELIFGITYGP
jgi:hypothetical protein